MCGKLKRKYKLNEEIITRVKEKVKQRLQLKVQRMQRYEKRGKFYRQSLPSKHSS